MRANEIKEVLDNELVGKEYSGYSFGSSVYSVIRKLLPNLSNDYYRGLSYKTSGQTVSITYKDTTIIRVECKKLKGKYHYSYFGSYYDWTFKGFSVFVCGNDDNLDADTSEAIGLATKWEEARLARQDADLQKAIKAAKCLMKEFNCDIYEAARLADLIKNRRYSSAFEAAVKAD